jgi:hypothetical protein
VEERVEKRLASFLQVFYRGIFHYKWTKGAGFTNFTKFLIRILLSFYHVVQAPRRTLVGLYQHIPTNSVGESGPLGRDSPTELVGIC